MLFHFFQATLIKGDIADAIPLTVFGIANFVGAALCLTLPETLNRKLPDTIAEADNFDRYETEPYPKVVN